MARFVYRKNETGTGWVTFEGADGDELTPDQVTAWAALESEARLSFIGSQLGDLINACQQ